MHEMKLPPLPLPPFYKEPTDGVLQSMLSHTVWFTMEYKQNQKKPKRHSQKREKGYRRALASCSVSSLAPFLSQAFPLLPCSQFGHNSLHSQEKSFPKQCQFQAGIWPVFIKHVSKQVRCGWQTGEMQHPEENNFQLRRGTHWKDEFIILFHRILATPPFKMDYFWVRHKMEIFLSYHSAYWAVVTETNIMHVS